MTWKYLILILLLIMLVYGMYTQARAISPSDVCRSGQVLHKQLAEKYFETPVAQGIHAGGKGLLTVYASEGGSWSVVSHSTRGFSCMIAAGSDFQLLKPKETGVPG